MNEEKNPHLTQRLHTLGTADSQIGNILRDPQVLKRTPVSFYLPPDAFNELYFPEHSSNGELRRVVDAIPDPFAEVKPLGDGAFAEIVAKIKAANVNEHFVKSTIEEQV